MDRLRERPVLRVDEDSVTVGQMIDYVRRRLLLEDKPLRLKRLLQPMQSRNALICTFLALLELVRLQAILLRQEAVFGEILIKKHENFESVMGERSTVRDDWK
jgi:segregation and condensation protein A